MPCPLVLSTLIGPCSDKGYGELLTFEDFSSPELPGFWNLYKCSIGENVLPLGDKYGIEYATISNSLGKVAAVEFDFTIVDRLDQPDSIFSIIYNNQSMRFHLKHDRVTWINSEIYNDLGNKAAGCRHEPGKPIEMNRWYHGKILYMSGAPLLFVDDEFYHMGYNPISG